MGETRHGRCRKTVWPSLTIKNKSYSFAGFGRLSFKQWLKVQGAIYAAYFCDYLVVFTFIQRACNGAGPSGG